MAEVSDVKLPSDECQWTSLMTGQQQLSQRWWWLGAIKQQAITWGNADPDLCHHVVLLGHNVSTAPHFISQDRLMDLIIYGTQL